MTASKLITRLRIRLHQIAFAGVLVLMLLADSRWNTGALEIVGSLLFFVGLCLVAAAVLGRLWCMLYIGGQKTSTLVTEGPYSLSRNPLYFLSLLGAIGVGMCTKTFTIPLLIFACVFPVYHATIKTEEAKLARQHGDTHSRYCRAVPRFFPKFSAFKEPRETPVDLKVYRTHMAHVSWFIVAVAALELRLWTAPLLLW